MVNLLYIVRRRERYVGLSSIIIIVYGCSHLFTLALNTEPRGPPDLLVTLCPILGQVLAVAGHLRAFCTPGLSEFKEYKKQETRNCSDDLCLLLCLILLWKPHSRYSSTEYMLNVVKNIDIDDSKFTVRICVVKAKCL